MPRKPYARRNRQPSQVGLGRQSLGLRRARLSDGESGYDLWTPGRSANRQIAALRHDYPDWEIGPGPNGRLVADLTDGTRRHRVVAQSPEELREGLDDAEEGNGHAGAS